VGAKEETEQVGRGVGTAHALVGVEGIHEAWSARVDAGSFNAEPCRQCRACPLLLLGGGLAWGTAREDRLEGGT
jgi:hypothetical protein